MERSIPILDERRKTMPESHAIGEYACDTQVLWPADVFDANPEDNLIYEMYALGVHSDYRGRGLGRILVEESFKVSMLPSKCVFA